MIRHAPLRQAMSLIKKNRRKRKIDIHKMAFGLMVDKTTAVYLLIIVGYIFISMFIVGDFINDYYDQFIMVETQMQKRIWTIFTILPIAYVIQSFSRPGILFSKTEYQLSILPYSREKIWLICAAEKWIKKLIVYIVLGSLISLVTPISLLLVLIYISLLLTIDLLMTIPQWKLFQMTVLAKIGWLSLVLVINFVNILFNLKMIGIVCLVILFFMNIRLARTLFKKVNWGRVTEVSDFQLWNMPIIARASKVEMKRRKLYSIFQNTEMLRSPLPYTKQAIHQRLWLVYLVRNLKLILQTIGSLLALLIVFIFINDFIFHLAIVLTIHIYTSIMASFFRGRFEDDILQVLPWQLFDFKRSFFSWVCYGAIILLIPIATYLSIHASILVPFQLLLYIVVYVYLFLVKIDKEIIILSKKYISIGLYEGIGYLFLIAIIFSWKYPFILFTTIIAVWLIQRIKKQPLFE